jgi:multidrug efflux pump subunit AcrB
MPASFDTIFFTEGDTTYRLHFPYIIGGVNKSMIQSDDEGKFTSDTREYYIKDFTWGSTTFNIYVRETGADILPTRIDVWFIKGDKIESIPLDLLADIKMRNEEATQNRAAIKVNGKNL